MDESQTSRLFELCDSNSKGYLTKFDLSQACPQLSASEVDFIFSCLDTNNSGTIEKSEFVAGFEETLFQGESQGFGGIQERANQKSPSISRNNNVHDELSAGSSSSIVVVFSNEDYDDEEVKTLGKVYKSDPAHTRPSSALTVHRPMAPRVASARGTLLALHDEGDEYGTDDCGFGYGIPRHLRSYSASPIPATGHKNGQLDYLEAEDSDQLAPTTVSYISTKGKSQSLRSPKFLKRKPQPQFSVDIPCKDEVLQLYEELQSSGVPQIMSKFEEVVGNLCREIDQKREENQLLQNIQRTERDNYNKRMTEIENEMDQQLIMAEKKAREEESKRLTKEKQELKERLEAEMHELQENIEHLQKMEKVLRKESREQGNSAERKDELRGQLNNIARENQSLKNNLADNHLEMTLIKAELAQLKSEFESRSLGVGNAYETAESVANTAKAENMQRQLQLLYDANKRLHDTNGNLRGALDQRTAVIRQLNMAKQNPMENIISHGGADPPNTLSFPNPDDDDRDSGFAHARSVSSRTSISDADLFRCASVDTAKESASNSNYTSSLVEFCGPPDRTFRVVMCGDSSVGKSSIIMRIVKGVYQRDIASTLGVDFHVKCIKMDKTNVAVQLWDTAGQERFRSLCNSYFRRADGAILVYDCSVEKSFLRIRDWIETVKDSICKSIPILLVGNKIDLRRQFEELHVTKPHANLDESPGADGESLAQIFEPCSGEPNPVQANDMKPARQSTFDRQTIIATTGHSNFVSQKDGENLSKVLETEFIECSASDGTNIEAALLLLVGEMMKQEDIQIKNTTVELTKSGRIKPTGCFSCRNA